MALVPLKIPPGAVRAGTVYDSRGHWYDMSLVRWKDGVSQPWGGWQVMDGLDAGSVNAPVRGMMLWTRNNGNPYLIFGATNYVFVYALPGVAGPNGSMVVGPMGLATMQVGNVDASGVTEASVWSFGAYGEDVILCASHNESTGVLWYFDTSTGLFGSVTADAGGDAPVAPKACFVTPERFIVALCGSDDPRRVQWSDREAALSSGDWDIDDATNEAGMFVLQSQGGILAGRPARDESLIWTTTDFWAMRYTGNEFVYGFQQLGNNCGAVSRQAMAVIGTQAVWMGKNKFFLYDGYVREIPCTVSEYVFNRINRLQLSKVACDVRSDFNEVLWYYPSDAGTENDSYVAYNYVENHWTFGAIDRTSGVDRGPWEYPLAASSEGNVYMHEFEDIAGSEFPDESGAQLTPYLESGPVELGNGDRVATLRSIIPDEQTLGEIEVTIYSALYPTETEVAHGPYEFENPTDVRVTGRQFRFRYNGTGTNASASGTLVFTGVPADGNTVTIQGRTYTFKTTLTPTADEVLIGVSMSTAAANLIAAINGASGAGTTYVAGSPATNAHVSAVLTGSGGTATATLTASANVSNNDTVVIEGRTYTFKTTLTGAADEVLIGSDDWFSLIYLARAINGASGAGTEYVAGSPQVNAHVSAGNVTTTNATSTLTFTSQPNDNDTVTIDGRVYTFKTTLGATADNVLRGADATASRNNLIAAINGASGAGTTYVAGSPQINPDVVASASGGNMLVTSRTSGASANAITTAESTATVRLSWTGATLSGGTSYVVVTSRAAGAGSDIDVSETSAGLAWSGATLSGGAVTVTVTARTAGSAGNYYTTTDVGANIAFSAATLSGGLDSGNAQVGGWRVGTPRGDFVQRGKR